MAKNKNMMRTAACVLVGVLSLAAVAGSATALVMGGKKSGWFDKVEETPIDQPAEQTPDSGDNVADGLIVETADANSRMAFNVVKLASTTLSADDGIAAQAEDSYTITATVYDEAGQSPSGYQLVTWTMAWSSTTTATLSEYMTMTTSGTSATFNLVKGFNTPITVTCTSNIDTSIKKTVTFNYARRFKGINVNLGTATAVTNGSVVNASMEGYSTIYTAPWATAKYTFSTMTYNYDSVGTVNDSTTAAPNSAITVTLSDAVKTALAAKDASVTPQTATFVAGTAYTQNEIIAALFNLSGTTPQDFAHIYNVLDVLSSTTNQLKVTYNVGTFTKSGSATVTYTVNLSVPAAKVASMTIDPSASTYLW